MQNLQSLILYEAGALERPAFSVGGQQFREITAVSGEARAIQFF
jgi:hypothetical protein